MAAAVVMAAAGAAAVAGVAGQGVLRSVMTCSHVPGATAYGA